MNQPTASIIAAVIAGLVGILVGLIAAGVQYRMQSDELFYNVNFGIKWVDSEEF